MLLHPAHHSLDLLEKVEWPQPVLFRTPGLTEAFINVEDSGLMVSPDLRRLSVDELGPQFNGNPGARIAYGPDPAAGAVPRFDNMNRNALA
jgi:hypothetical protein